MAHDPEAPTNWAQARARIDRGGAGDKIAADDPAAAPLGTDAEAGGAATAGEDIARSTAMEAAGEGTRAAAQTRLTAGRRRVLPWVAVILALAAAVLLAVLITA